jgi:hypothetical protein
MITTLVPLMTVIVKKDVTTLLSLKIIVMIDLNAPLNTVNLELVVSMK